MDISLKEKVPGRIYWVFIALICLVRGALIIPNLDDGINFLHLYNTMGWKHPFYNDYFGQPFHFNRPLILLYALLYTFVGSPAFRLIALVHAAELFACIGLFYACVRRYASEEASQAGALLFLYFLFVQPYLSPTRPETTVLLCALATFWLCDRFSDTRNVRYLCCAGALTFLVALPMHTNGSIPFMYLALFTITQRRQLSRGPAIQLALCSLLCGLAGATLLLYPHVSSFAQALALFSYDGSRFGMFTGEYVRLRQFVKNYYNFPLMLLLVALAAGLLLSEYRDLTLSGLKRYRSLFMFLLAVVLGLVVLPAATWEVYAVYYLLPLMAGFSVALDRYARCAGRYYAERLLLAAIGLAALWHGLERMPELYFLLCVLPFFLAAVLPGRLSVTQTLAVIVIPMLVFSMVCMGASKIIYDRAGHRIGVARGVVIANPLFNFSGGNVLQAGIYDIRDNRGVATIELLSVVRTKADLINAHPLVTFFGQPPPLRKESRWASRRELGQSFRMISNNEWGFLDEMKERVKKLGYAVVDDVPLSRRLFDRYADPSLKRLRCVEFRRTFPPS
jgi:hypothetical protein